MYSENDQIVRQEEVFQWLPRVEDGPMRLEPSCIMFSQENDAKEGKISCGKFAKEKDVVQQELIHIKVGNQFYNYSFKPICLHFQGST